MVEGAPQEAWNMATETMKRLSRSLDLISFFSQQQDLVSWFDATLDLRRNISPFLEEPEFEKINQKLNGLPSDWLLKGRRVNKRRYKDVHRTLDEVYLMIIKHMKDKGLLLPKAQDPRKAALDM